MIFTITPEQAGQRLDKVISANIGTIGRAGVKRLFDDKRVHWIDDRERKHLAHKGDAVVAGSRVEIALDESAHGVVASPEQPLDVVFETANLVIVNKPAGQPTAPLRPGETGTLVNALIARYPEMMDVGFSDREPGICHRLDTDTSGLVVAARNKETFVTIGNILKANQLDKRYILYCEQENIPDSGTIEFPLAPHPKDRRRVYACIHPRDVIRYAPRSAITYYEVLSRGSKFAQVEVRAPKASRHQIRAHFAAIEHPLVGDSLYGGPHVEGISRQCLHAYRITWAGNSNLDAFDVTCPIPADMNLSLSPVNSKSCSDPSP